VKLKITVRMDILFSPYALSHIIGDLEHADGVYGWDLFVDHFNVEALETISNGGYVSFEERINVESSVSNCPKNITERTINTDQLFLNLSLMPSCVSNELNITNSRLSIFQYSSNHSSAQGDNNYN